MSFRFRSRTVARSVAVIAISGLAALGIAGCSNSGTSSASSGGSATSGTVNWWGWSPTVQVAGQYIKAFNKVYPNIKVNYKFFSTSGYVSALRPAINSPVGPDVFDMAPGQDVTEFGRFAQNMTPVIEKKLGSDWKSKIAGVSRTSLTTSGGKLVGLSIGLTYAGTMWINQDLFSKYHVKTPTTFTELISDCKTFAAAGVQCFTQGAGDTANNGYNIDTYHAIVNSLQPGLWEQALDGKAKWTDPVFVKGLELWKQMFTDGVMEKGALGLMQHPDAQNGFLSGKAASIMMGTWFMQYTTKSSLSAGISAAGVSDPKPFTIKAIPFPDVKGAGNSTLFGEADYGLAVNTKSKVKSAATTFATWLTTTTKGQQLVANALDDVPSLIGVKPQYSEAGLVDQSVQEPNLNSLIKETGSVTDLRLANLDATSQQAIGFGLAAVAQGSSTPEKTASTIQSKLQK